MYPLALLISALVIYLIANDMHGWYIYVLLGFLILERAFLQLALWLLAKAQQRMAKHLQETLKEAMTQGFGQSTPFDQDK